jgi:hypothetical protein
VFHVVLPTNLFYNHKDIMILEAVQSSVALEGMKAAAQECEQEILELKKKATG